MMNRRMVNWAVSAAVLAVTWAARVHAAESRWVETQSWSGTGTRQTELFLVNGIRWRLVHRHKGDGIFQVGVYDAQGSFLDMAADLREPVSSSKVLPGRGHRYLAINGVDTEWTVTVEQYLSIIEEWQLTEERRKPPPAYEKLGTWFGADTDVDYEIQVPAGSWKILHSHSGAGMLQISVRDQKGFVMLAANTTDAGQSESWIHQSGTFRMRIRAVKCQWKVDVLYRGQAPR